MIRAHVLVCGGTGCTSSKSVEIMKSMREEIEKVGLSDKIQVVGTGCFGLCALGPIVIVYPEGTFYSCVKVADVPEIVSEHFVNGTPVDRLLYHEADKENVTRAMALSETAF